MKPLTLRSRINPQSSIKAEELGTKKAQRKVFPSIRAIEFSTIRSSPFLTKPPIMPCKSIFRSTGGVNVTNFALDHGFNSSYEKFLLFPVQSSIMSNLSDEQNQIMGYEMMSSIVVS